MPTLLLITAVLPLPRHSGQQMRVYNKLVALRDHFHVTLLTFAPPADHAAISDQLAPLTDDVILLPARTTANPAARLYHAAHGRLHALRHHLRPSNYRVSHVELTPARIAAHCDPAAFDLVLFEYWHAHAATTLFRPQGIPCVLDMHDLLWRVVDRRLRRRRIPAPLRRRRVAAYRAREEAAWRDFDALITINEAEDDYIAHHLPDMPRFYTPMGLDLAAWPYAWQPADPPRLAFYGALGSLGNQQEAQRCVEQIMPRVWATYPATELFIVGGNPPPAITALAADPRVHVTGFVPDVAATLATMTAVLCPWHGRFGFRSRLVEVMAVGVPVVASPDAVHGMGLAPGEGLLLGDDDDALAAHAQRLLADPDYTADQSRRARAQVAAQFSFDVTYGALARNLAHYARQR